jgi:hypothetical protein
MKKIIFVGIISLILLSGFVYSTREVKNETTKKSTPKPLSAAESKAALKKWQASPDGIQYKKWQESPAGKKVHTSIAKISQSIKNKSNMEAVVTSLSLPPGSRLGFGVMVRINDADYILTLGLDKSGKKAKDFKNEYEQLNSLNVNDKISIRCHSVSQAPKYSYPILSGDYVERAGRQIYKRAVRKGGC